MCIRDRYTTIQRYNTTGQTAVDVFFFSYNNRIVNSRTTGVKIYNGLNIINVIGVEDESFLLFHVAGKFLTVGFDRCVTDIRLQQIKIKLHYISLAKYDSIT